MSLTPLRQLLHNYTLQKINLPSYQHEEALFPVNKRAFNYRLPGIENFKRTQISQILDNKLYRSQEAQRDIGLLSAAQDWFERFSDPLFQKYFEEHEDNSLELSLFLVENNAHFATYIIIPASCYLELQNQIQMPILKGMADEEKTKWGEKNSETFVNNTLNKSKIHGCSKCFIFKDLEKRIEEAKCSSD